jgi:hypothetical protein
MAVKGVVLEKIEERLNCPICLEAYSDPKLLQCNHVFCQQCLVPLVVGYRRRRQHLTCPTCRQDTVIPDLGVVGLRPAFHVNQLLEIKDSVQKLRDPVDTIGSGVCSHHAGRELELYCETCEELICYKCIAKNSGQHHNHDYEEVDVAFEKYMEEICHY